MTGSGALGISLILLLLGVAMVITLFTLIVILLMKVHIPSIKQMYRTAH